MLTFESFDIEAHPSCKYDYVQVSFGSDEQKYCGSNKPSPIISSDNRMTVIFHSDGSEVRNGFKATWKAVETSVVETSGSGMSYVVWVNIFCGTTEFKCKLYRETNVNLWYFAKK